MHIVLVDGSRTGLMIIKRMLDPRGDTLVFFTDGQDALDYIRTTPEVDVVITSFEITSLPGTELCWQTRVLANAGRAIYVIAMSANNDPGHVISVLDAGADDFMSKPPRADELHARMRVAERTLVMQRKLIELATLDALSGLLNRRALRDRTDALVASLKPGEPLSILLFDLDHFKRVNDAYGHDVGDAAIRAVGSLRPPADALFGRVGGEEFSIVLPGVPIDGAESVADYMRSVIEGLEIDARGKTISITASFGVSEMVAGESLADLYRRADAALFLSKNNGRNRVSALAPPQLAA